MTNFPLSGSEATAYTVTIETSRKVEAGAPSRSLPSPRHSSQAYFWTTEWQQRERLADYDFLIGDTFKPANADDLIQQLHEAARGETDQAS